MATYVWRGLSADFSIDLNAVAATHGHHIFHGCGDDDQFILGFATKTMLVLIFKCDMYLLRYPPISTLVFDILVEYYMMIFRAWDLLVYVEASFAMNCVWFKGLQPTLCNRGWLEYVIKGLEE